MTDELQNVERIRAGLETALNELIQDIATLQIFPPDRFPLGWRKAAKGRTVWRLLEEMITQNLEVKHQDIGIQSFSPATSEVGVYDFIFSLDGQERVFVNIKSAIKGERLSKDDISNARKLEEFFSADATRILLIATFEIEFLANMTLQINKCTVLPVMWIPDIYVNPSNNANLQSSRYKSIQTATRRTGLEFLELLRGEIKKADEKGAAKRLKQGDR
jgi:hypothetical protein